MPAVTVPSHITLPRLTVSESQAQVREAQRVITAGQFFEGDGFPVRRPFPGRMSMSYADPFLLLDHMGAVEYGPGEARGAPWHPHRGFETVTYMLDGELVHHDSHGGGGKITDGDTQWMTAGGGILHDEMPSEQLLRAGGTLHGVQLWVNLPRSAKMNPPKYQDIHSSSLTLLRSHDAGALLRVIAGELGGHTGPGRTHTPITYAHATLQPGAQIQVPWNSQFTAMIYSLNGSGRVGRAGRPLTEGQLVVLGEGNTVMLCADSSVEGPADQMDVLLLGGQPIREPVFHYGPFVMNTREEVITAIEDFQHGRLGQLPAEALDVHQVGESLDT